MSPRCLISGSLSLSIDLKKCEDMTQINVGNTEVAGHLEDLEGMVHLTHVCCDFSQVSGDIISAAHWPELKSIYLNGKQITGDLSVFRKKCKKVLKRLIKKNDCFLIPLPPSPSSLFPSSSSSYM